MSAKSPLVKKRRVSCKPGFALANSGLDAPFAPGARLARQDIDVHLQTVQIRAVPR